MAAQQVPVRTALIPLYYKDFRCLAGACRNTCCAGWKIEFSKKDYLAIKRAPQSQDLKDRLSKGMARLREEGHDGLYAEFPMNEEDRCSLLREDGLCALQVECGLDILPEICKHFPRADVYTPAAREYGLSLACEAVLALLWDLPEGIDFWEEPLEKKDWRTYKVATPTEARFGEIRSFCIDVLQERSMTLRQRMLMLGFLLQKLRDMDWEREETADEWLVQAGALLHEPVLTEKLSQLPENKALFLTNAHQGTLISAVTEKKNASELFRSLWTSIAATVSDGNTNKVTFDLERYEALEAQLEDLLGHSEAFFENIMVAMAFEIQFPFLSSPEELWKSYVNLCNLYSLYRFSAVCGCDKEVSRERLFQVLAIVSRGLLHNKDHQTRLRDDLFRHDSSTLAHMAILLCG